MTSDTPPEPQIKIEPFDPEVHDRAAFSCGTERIDNFLKSTAKKHQQGDFTRVWVAVGKVSPKILGYYSINSHSIQADDLPEKFKKGAPRHGAVAAAYLSTFGVDASVQGKGIGKILLADALKRIARISEQMGIFAVVLDVLDDGDRAQIEKRHRFYESFGFIDFPSHALRMFLPIRTIRAILK
ncbi:MAG: GNAT family N-acetyltransferase [Alphaproteobacteria bacterium]|nr:GNAT family N-acetyltransferase [Alphaproteobacteria bacterium]